MKKSALKVAAFASALVLLCSVQSARAVSPVAFDLSKASTIASNSTLFVKKIECSTADKCTVIGTSKKGDYNYAFQQTFLVKDWSKQQFTLMPIFHAGYPYVRPGYRDSELDDLACGKTFCVAVGSHQMTLSSLAKPKIVNLMSPDFGNHIVPTSWGSYVSIDCVSSAYCVAVGDQFHCGGAEDCTDNPLKVYVGDPRNWTYKNAKTVKMNDYSTHKPTALSCFAVRQCVVFFESNPEYKSKYYVGDLNKITRGAIKVKQYMANFNAAKCWSATDCIAVGHKFGDPTPEIFVGNPAKWTQNNQVSLNYVSPDSGDVASWPYGSPMPPLPDDEETFGHIGFTGVSCSSPTSCFAIGVDESQNAIFAQVDPKTSTAIDVQLVPQPAGMAHVLLTAITCDPNRCLVAGKSNKGVFLSKFDVAGN